jgi:glucosamine 6-phosphate synthetase-like amidotransferase/phosphosugar isomerase protein
MCGIAGFSLSYESRLDRTLAAQALLASIAERGADAVGYAWRAEGDKMPHVHKQCSGASALMTDLEVPAQATQLLVHVRDYTKGHPTIEANNHPIRHGAVVGVHNGVIQNDDEVLGRHRIERERKDMTVDSEVIFALAERAFGQARTFEQLRGSMAAAWMDERRSELFVARGVGRPLWLGHTRHEVLFASTREALEIVERTLRMTLSKREVPEGIVLELDDGRVVAKQRFTPSRAYAERALPAVRAPHERASCLQQLAVLAAAA